MSKIFTIELIPDAQEFNIVANSEMEAKSEARRRFSAFNNCPIRETNVVEVEDV